MSASVAVASADWSGPGAKDRKNRLFSWHALLWSLVFPPKRHRISPTVPGLFLMMLAMGIGTAAYNTASNILFITLSLLLACLLLSGLLSWFNFMGVCWRIRPPGPWRAGHETLVAVEVQNRKQWLPSYGLWFELMTQPRRPPAGDKPAEAMKVREILAAIDKLVTRGRVFMRERLEAQGETTLEWGVKPTQRGAAVVELSAVGSLFPFGFLKKNIGVALRHPVLVWPAQVAYTWTGAVAAPAGSSGRRTARAGTGDDLLALRKYERGDSHRLIHWKASARLGQLMLRQFAAESHDGYLLRLDTPAGVWTRPGQFELLCSFAGTMAEDLYAAGRLRGVSVNGGPLIDTRRLRDVEAFLDELALLEPVGEGGGVPPSFPRVGGTPPPASKNTITFVPEGARGVAAYVDGHQTATA
ncbi:MAG: DUF58 domain-containing protein [Lacunisphaera sp.]|nr:DUF58 domain-containing protein [Lacunisphaera sp.]